MRDKIHRVKYLLTTLSLVCCFFSGISISALEKKFDSEVSPYLLPRNHPLKKKLDKIFKPGQFVILNSQTLEKAGFEIVREGHNKKIYVVSHEKLDGYLLKLLTIEEDPVNRARKFTKRLLGAEAAQDAIDQHGIQTFFKAPEKWIYSIPSNTIFFKQRQKRNLILVVEDMRVLPREENLMMWQSAYVTEDFLNALFILLNELGLSDHGPRNIPFCYDGRVAFVDLGSYQNGNLQPEVLGKKLSPEMEKYWESLWQEWRYDSNQEDLVEQEEWP